MRKLWTHYDVYERHQAVNTLIPGIGTNPILDVGGFSGYLKGFLSAGGGTNVVVSLNVDNTGDVRYSGGHFPFQNNSFASIVSLDTLEHIPREARTLFVQECIRVAQRNVLIAAPFGSPGHISYEIRLDEIIKDVYGESNRWLHEHILNGLPQKEEIDKLIDLFRSNGFEVNLLFAGDYIWQCGNMERSVKLQKALGPIKKVGFLYDLLLSMAIWRKIEFSEDVYDRANRFYILAHSIRNS